MKSGVIEEMDSNKEIREMLVRFLTNDWVHLERRVAATEARVTILLGASGIIIGLMVYAVTK